MLEYKLTVVYMAGIQPSILSNVLFICALNSQYTLTSVQPAFYTGVHKVL